ILDVKVSRDTQLALLARRVSRLAAEYGVTSHCLVASFSAEFLRKMRETDAEIATSFLLDHPVALPEAGQRTPLFPPVDAVGPPERTPLPPPVRAAAPPADLVAAPLIAQASAARLSVPPWTADAPEEIRRLLEAGVASVTTNVPDLALRLRQEAPPAPKPEER